MGKRKGNVFSPTIPVTLSH